MSKYLDPKADLTFKRVFGEHKELTISFLNSLLDFSGDERICSIEYQTPEMLPDTSARKYSIVDVKCTDSLQRQFIVEMQMVWTTDFLKRILHNTTRAYSRQLRKGEDYASCMPVYTLCLLNENLPKDTFKRTERPVLLAERSPFDCSDFMHVFRLMEEGSPDHVIEGLNIVFVELKKFNPSSVMYKKMMVLWLRYLTEIDENTSDVPAEMLACAEIRQAIDILERSAYTDAQLDSYDDFWDGVRVSLSLDPDYRFKKGLVEGEAVGMKKGEAVGMKKGEAIGMKKGEAIGMKKGEAIGMEKGAKAKAVEMAKILKRKGVDIDTIALASGLSPDEINRLPL